MFYIHSHLIPIAILKNGWLIFFYLTDQELEAQRGQGIYPRSRGLKVLEPRSFGGKARTLSFHHNCFS